MDNLAREAMLAKTDGMSYGRWKAMQKPKKAVTKVIPEGWKECAYCGKPFKAHHGMKYCDIYCRTKAYAPKEKEIKAEYMRKWREKQEGVSYEEAKCVSG